jgi:hypothetical protein
MEWQSFAKAGHEEVSPNPEEHLILETVLKSHRRDAKTQRVLL